MLNKIVFVVNRHEPGVKFSLKKMKIEIKKVDKSYSSELLSINYHTQIINESNTRSISSALMSKSLSEEINMILEQTLGLRLKGGRGSWFKFKQEEITNAETS